MSGKTEKPVIRIEPTAVKRKRNALKKQEDAETLALERKEREDTHRKLTERNVKAQQKKMVRSGKKRALVVGEDEYDQKIELMSGDDVSDDDEEEEEQIVQSCDKPNLKSTNETLDDVFSNEGTMLSAPQSLYKITRALKHTDGPLNADDILQRTKIDIRDTRNARFKNRLRSHSAITVVEDSNSDFVIKRTSPLGVESRADLEKLFSDVLPRGKLCTRHGNPILVVCDDELLDSYKNAYMDIDHMIHSNEIAACVQEHKAETRVLIPRLPAASVSPTLMAFWKDVQDPNDSMELKEKLQAHGLLTRTQQEMRKDREVKKSRILDETFAMSATSSKSVAKRAKTEQRIGKRQAGSSSKDMGSFSAIVDD